MCVGIQLRGPQLIVVRIQGARRLRRGYWVIYDNRDYDNRDDSRKTSWLTDVS